MTARPTLIRDLPGKARPRETALELGVERTGDDVLLAILLRTGGRRGQGVLELARDVLARCGHSLERLADASVEELVALPEFMLPLAAHFEYLARKLVPYDHRVRGYAAGHSFVVFALMDCLI